MKIKLSYLKGVSCIMHRLGKRIANKDIFLRSRSQILFILHFMVDVIFSTYRFLFNIFNTIFFLKNFL